MNYISLSDGSWGLGYGRWKKNLDHSLVVAKHPHPSINVERDRMMKMISLRPTETTLNEGGGGYERNPKMV